MGPFLPVVGPLSPLSTPRYTGGVQGWSAQALKQVTDISLF